MRWYGILFLTFFIIFICVSITNNYQNNDPTDSSLLSFSSAAQFKPPPDSIDVPDNSKTPELHKQKCNKNDPNPCSKYPNTVCEHFEEEIKVHFNVDGAGSTTIKNEDFNEGYCMNLQALSSRCNLFHGDWALIKKSNEDHSYMKVCVCKRPGYIGNIILFDSCEYPFICNGQIVDINTHFEAIECVCKKDEESTHIKNDDDGHVEVPVCTLKKIKSVTNWNSILIPPELKNNLINADFYFNKDISSNIGSLDELIDPCSICPLTGQQTGAEAIHAFSEANTTVFCATRKRNWGIPFRRSTESRLLKGNFGPDGVLAVKWDRIVVQDDGVGTNPQTFTYIISPISENKKFYDALNIDFKQYAINVGDNNFLSVTILPKSSFIPRLFGYADGSWSLMKASSIAHDSFTQNKIDHFYVNPEEGNLISSVAEVKSSVNTNDGFAWTPSPLRSKKFDERFHYLTYKEEFHSGPIRKKFNLKGFSIRPLTDDNIHNSHWPKHKLDDRCYFVDFLVSE